MYVSFGCHLAVNWLRGLTALVSVLAGKPPTPKKAGKGTPQSLFCQ